MSQEASPGPDTPPQGGPSETGSPDTAAEGGAPQGLLEQMEELMAALSADLTQLDADLQSTTAGRPPAQRDANGENASGATDEATDGPADETADADEADEAGAAADGGTAEVADGAREFSETPESNTRS